MIESAGIQTVLPGWTAPPKEKTDFLIGVFHGEGVGPEVIEAAIAVLQASARDTRFRFELQAGGKIGLDAQRKTGKALTPDAIGFCEAIFGKGGAVMCGPAGGRFVYNLRKHFGLFCKLSPVAPLKALRDAGVLRPEAVANVDILMVRENSGGIYMGRWSEERSKKSASAAHSFEYKKDEVERILNVAFGLAAKRQKRLSLVLKKEGVPSISRLWVEVMEQVAVGRAVEVELLEIDNAVFRLVQYASKFDVIVSPNLFGDILADLGGVLLGSRGMCFSGNFGPDGRAVYQTGHGSAHDLVGRDQANPIGQIHSLAMLLRANFGLQGIAARIEQGVEQVLGAGFRTPDIAAPGATVIGTREMGRRIAEAVEQIGPPEAT